MQLREVVLLFVLVERTAFESPNSMSFPTPKRASNKSNSSVSSVTSSCESCSFLRSRLGSQVKYYFKRMVLNLGRRTQPEPDEERKPRNRQTSRDQSKTEQCDAQSWQNNPLPTQTQKKTSSQQCAGSRWEALQEGNLKGEVEKLNLKVRWGRLRSPLKVPSKPSKLP